LTSLGVSLGVALFVAIHVINRSTIQSFRESVESISGKSALVVSAGETGFSEEKLEVVVKTPGVRHAIPIVETRAFFAGPKSMDEPLTILGVDLLKESTVRTYKTTNEQVMDDPLIFLNQPDSIIVTRTFAEQHDLKIDSTFELASAHGKKRLVVRGLLNPEGPAKAYGGALAIMDIDGARMTFGKEGKIDRIDVVPRDPKLLEEVKAALEKRLGPGFSVVPPDIQHEGLEKLIQSYQAMLSFFSTMALLAGIFLVTNAVGISVAERRREIGVLRAVGATRRGILTLFLSEAAIMGVLGSALGVWLGRGLAELLINMVTKSISVQYLTPIQSAHVFFGASDIAKGMGIGVTSAIIAAFWPSFKAMRVGPLEAMQRVEVGSINRGQVFGYLFWSGALMMLFLTLSSVFKWGAQSAVIENLGQAFGVVGPAFLGPGLVVLLVKLFRKPTMKFGGTVTRLAQDNLLLNPRRTGSNVTTLMVGLILVIIAACINISFRKGISEWCDQVMIADVFVSSYGRISSYQTQPIKEEIGRELEKIPGVNVGSHGIGAYGIRFIHLQYGGQQIALKSYDQPDPGTGYKGFFVVKDRDHAEAGADLYTSKDTTVFVSENFGIHFKKKTGDTIDIDTPNGRQTARIVGTVVDYSSPQGVIYLSRANYKKFWNDSLVNAFAVGAAPGFSIPDLQKNIDQKFGRSQNIMTVANQEMKAQIDKNIDESFAYTRAIEGAALLVAMMSLLNTFLISVMERKRELGMLRAIGMSRPQLIFLILQESLVQGAFGAIVAVGLGTWVAKLYITGSLSYVLGWIVDFSFPWSALFTTVGTGIVVTLIAGFYPAWKAARTEIREALEYE
jgi:putative ABC transport system permease protein